MEAARACGYLENLSIGNKLCEERSGWESCPLDVLLLIFDKLSPQDLMKCISVNSVWRDAVSFIGRHRGMWHKLAQAGMVNKGIAFRRRSTAGWQDLYNNSRLWFHVKQAQVNWQYELSDTDIRSLHVYKDILIVQTGDELYKKYYQIKDRLQDVTKDLVEASLSSDENDESSNTKSTSKKDNFARNCDRMILKLAKEGSFKRLLVFDEDCFYLLDDKNVLRCSKWDDKNQRWLDYVLARYYGCSSSISDINVYNNEVYMLVKTGLIFKLDKLGRNFIPENRLDISQSRALQYSRMLHSNVLGAVEKVSSLKLPQYSTGRNVMFNKISAVVSVPTDKNFAMSTDTKTRSVVLECPGLSCAAQHGDVLFLGYKDGRVEVCISKRLRKNDGHPEISTFVQNCLGYKDKNPEIIGLEVYEAKESHHIFVATHTSVYRLVITYPDHVKQALGLAKSDTRGG